MDIWGDDDQSLARNALIQFYELALITRNEGGSANTSLYSQHSLLHNYSLALLKRKGEDFETGRRHFDYYRGEIDYLLSYKTIS